MFEVAFKPLKRNSFFLKAVSLFRVPHLQGILGCVHSLLILFNFQAPVPSRLFPPQPLGQFSPFPLGASSLCIPCLRRTCPLPKPFYYIISLPLCQEGFCTFLEMFCRTESLPLSSPPLLPGLQVTACLYYHTLPPLSTPFSLFLPFSAFFMVYDSILSFFSLL